MRVYAQVHLHARYTAGTRIREAKISALLSLFVEHFMICSRCSSAEALVLSLTVAFTLKYRA